MRYSELLQDEYIQKWILDAEVSPSTEKSYIMAMQYYTDFTKKTPEELIKEAKKEIRDGLTMDERRIRTYLNNFRKNLQDQELAPLTVRNRLVGVRSFYSSFYIDLPKLKKIGKARPTPENTEKIPTKEDIQTVLQYCDPLERALVLVGCSSGLSAEEITRLKVKDFKDGYNPKTEITTFNLIRQKTQVKFITFMTPEASRAVLEYLAFRERKPKVNAPYRLRQLEKQRLTRPEGYLFVQKNIPEEYLDVSKEELNERLPEKVLNQAWQQRENIRQIDKKTLMNLYRNLAERAQKSAPYGTWSLIRSHNMRKFFNTTLVNAGCGNIYVELWMGHTIDSTKDAYFRPDPHEIVKIYQNYIPYLTISKYLVVSDSDDYKRLKTEKEELERELHTQKLIDERELNELVAYEVEQRIGNYMKEMEEYKKEVSDIFKTILPDIDTPLTDEEKKAAKNAPDW
jgi:integrase